MVMAHREMQGKFAPGPNVDDIIAGFQIYIFVLGYFPFHPSFPAEVQPENISIVIFDRRTLLHMEIRMEQIDSRKYPKRRGNPVAGFVLHAAHLTNI